MISKVNESAFKKKEKEAIGLLSIGTFLEYFDMSFIFIWLFY
jgi:hypothetical protein